MRPSYRDIDEEDRQSDAEKSQCSGFGNEGRRLSVFVPGLRDNVKLIAGGNPGALTGLGAQPAPPVLSASFDSTGQLVVNSTGDFAYDVRTASKRPR